MTPSHTNRKPYPLFIAHLRGTQQEMGAQHGAMVRAAGNWGPVMAYYPRMPEILIAGGARAGRAAVRPIVEVGSAKLERARPAELRARTRAFLAALGLSPSLSRHYQSFDVFQNLVNTAGRYKLGPFKARLAEQAPAACSTLVSWGASSADGALRHARNFDFPGVGVWESRPAVIFCTPKEGLRYGFVGVRGADVAGVSAFNEAGIVVTPHTRFHDALNWSGISIVDLVHEIVRNARTLAQAERIIRARPIASSWGICVSSASERRAQSFEVCGPMIRVVEPGKGEDFLAVTNRYVHPDMIRGEVTISSAFVRNSDGRYALLRAKGAEGGLDTRSLQMLLGSNEDLEVPGVHRAVGGVPAQALSVHSVVVEPETQRVHVSVGPVPTGKGPWAEIEWSWKDSPGFHIERFDGAELPVHSEGRFDEDDAAAALTAFIEASAITGRAGDPGEAVKKLEEAVKHDPDDPTYRLLMGGATLQRGDFRAALGHFQTGLDTERSPFYRGQLLLWASRAAAAGGDRAAAESLRTELLTLQHPQLDHHHNAARQERYAPLATARLKKVRLNYHLADLMV